MTTNCQLFFVFYCQEPCDIIFKNNTFISTTDFKKFKQRAVSKIVPLVVTYTSVVGVVMF